MGEGLEHHVNASPSEKSMKTVLVLLLLALLGLSEAEYRRTVSYEGEVVVKWYVSSDIGDGRMQTRATLILFNPLPAALAATGRDCGHYWSTTAQTFGRLVQMASSFACPRPFTRRSTPDFQSALSKWEKTVQRGADQATWFEEYVSETSVFFLHVYNLIEWGTYSTIHYSQNIKICTALEYLYCCIYVSSNPIVCVLVTERGIFIVT